MRLSTILLSAALALATSVSYAQPLEDLFDYEEPRKPVGGDCDQVAAELGAGSTWRGEVSGKRFDTFNDQYHPFGVRGCFGNELECRVFLQQAITYAGRGPIYVASCRRGSD